jgi:transcriptional regulator with XRE-family HTH domain
MVTATRKAEIRNWYRGHRNLRGLTQLQCQRDAQLGVGRLTLIENAEVEPTADERNRLAPVLGVDPAQLPTLVDPALNGAMAS